MVSVEEVCLHMINRMAVASSFVDRTKIEGMEYLVPIDINFNYSNSLNLIA